MLSDAPIRQILVDRIDVQRQSVGIAVGVVEPGRRGVITYGHLSEQDPRPVNSDTIFEIGSETKVFTALLLADMEQRGELAMGDSVAKYLPDGVKTPERNGRAITLADLATHTSGLPRMPSNLSLKRTNPWADYTVDHLYQFLSTHRLTRDIGSQYEYSNLGGRLLGHVLARRAGSTYEALVQSRLCEPLGMRDTRITLTPEMHARLASGHNAALETVENWTVEHWYNPTLAVAGLRSSADDMLTFIAANLGYTRSPLSTAMIAMLKERRPAGRPGLEVALGWHILKSGGEEIVWHNGGTGGYRSFMGFEPKARIGVALLSNACTSAGVDDIGRHLLDPRVPLSSPPKKHEQVVVDPELFEGYLGIYRISPKFAITVTNDGGRLFVQATNQRKLEVFPESERDFFLKAVNAQITFVTDHQGRAIELVLRQSGRGQHLKRLDE